MNRLLHKMARVIAVCITITMAPTLLRRIAERIGCSSMDIPLSRIGVPQGPFRLDADPQCAGEMRSQNFDMSTLPPETTATIGPGPALPVRAAASDSEPAPSAM